MPPFSAARAEPGLGTVGSLAGLGGMWNAQAVPDSRTTLFALLATGAHDAELLRRYVTTIVRGMETR